MKNKIDPCANTTCGIGDIHDACNDYTCTSPAGTAVCSATPKAGSCDDNDVTTDHDTCDISGTVGQCVGTGKKICIAFSIKHLNW